MSFDGETLELIEAAVKAANEYGDRSIIALAGVPGTGKTYLSLAIAEKVASDPLFVREVQFHAGVGYEDLFEGLRPNLTGGFEVRQGSLMEWNDQALQDPDNTYVFLIEELTRANLSSVLGELLTYIEYRGRRFRLPYSRLESCIASNLKFVATFNPQDRSALELDDAVIRRLRIIDCPPSPAKLVEMLADVASADRAGSILVEGLANIFVAMQSRYPSTYSHAMPFGHGIFSGIQNAGDAGTLWEQRIRHMLRRPLAAPHPLAEELEELFASAMDACAAAANTGPPPRDSPDGPEVGTGDARK
jgi:hypothetical protein